MDIPIGASGLSHYPATARLEIMMAHLPATSRRIAHFVLGHVTEVMGMSAAQLAGEVACSQGSIVNLAKAVGYSSFQMLKIAIAQDMPKPVLDRHEPLRANDFAATAVRKVFARQIRAQQETRDFLDTNALARAVEAIGAARRVELFGTGSSGPVAKLACYALIRIGINANVVIDPEMQAVAAEISGPEIAIFSIPPFEPDQPMMAAMRLACERGAKTIVLTDMGKPSMHGFADIVLSAAGRRLEGEFDAIFSRTDQVAVLDALIACIEVRQIAA